MVRLRGMPRPGPPGRGMGRIMPRHMRPEPVLPPFGMPRGRLIRGHPVRPGLPRLPPPRMAPPPPPRLGLPPPLPPRRLPLPPHLPLPPRDLPPPMSRRPLPPPHMARRPGMPPPPIPPRPPMLPGPPHLRRPMRPGPPFARGRGGVVRRGVKRLGAAANGRAKKSKRKEKTEGEFFCESCDRGFKTQELLDNHIAEHQICGRDGCAFAAHPKIVEKHIQFQHESGLYHRITFTQNPDDVAKWIAERKRCYPTKENVERKEAQTLEMDQRGERIPKQGKPFHNKEKFDSWRDRKKTRNPNTSKFDGNGKQKRFSQPNFNRSNDETKWKDPEAWRGNLPKFPGTAAFPVIKDELQVENEGDKCFSDDDDSELNSAQVIDRDRKPVFSSILASLMENYGSDITDDEDEPTINQSTKSSEVGLQGKVVQIAEPIEQRVPAVTEKNSLQNNELEVRNGQDSDSGPEECSVQRVDTANMPIPKPCKEDNQANKPAEPKTTELTQPSRPKPPVRPPMRKYQLSLLEKLLQNEIRHERNAILQCVRYVVNNNFFGCGTTNYNC